MLSFRWFKEAVMDTQELVSLANWTEEHIQRYINVFEEFASICEQNTRSGQKQPIRPTHELLTKINSEMPLFELSIAQKEMFKTLGIWEYIGNQGVQFFDDMFDRETFDPADTASRARNAVGMLNEGIRRLMDARSALGGLGLSSRLTNPTEFTARIYFQRGASIDNMSDFKNMAADWDIIARGIAEAVGERTEDIRIIGADTGSVIIVAWMTKTVARAFAIVTKGLSEAAINIIQVKQAYNQMRHLGEMAELLEENERISIERKKAETRLIILAGMKEVFAQDMDAQKTGLLDRAIEKYLGFIENGGELDIVSPTDFTGADEEEKAALIEVKGAVEQARKLAADVKKMLPPPDNNPG